jgi:hypothetical protein
VGHGIASADCCKLENVQITSYQLGAAGADAPFRTTPLWSAPYTTGRAHDAQPLPVLMVIANQD